MKDFAVLTSDMELVLDIVEALEASGHSVKLLDGPGAALRLEPAPDALIIDAATNGLDERLPRWAAIQHVPIVLVGPEDAEPLARELGAHFVERSASRRPSRIGGRFPTDPDPLWPLVLLDTVEAAANEARPSRAPPRDLRLAIPRVDDADSIGPVLVIEDDDVNRALIGRVLLEAGFRVATASDGVDALSQLDVAAQLPGVIVLDLMMPRMNGWELQRVLAGNPRLSGIPLVVASALAPAPELTGVVSAQLHKPFEANQLVRAVARVVGSPVD